MAVARLRPGGGHRRDGFDGDREPFRQHLIAAIADEPDRPYWDSWTAALEKLVVQTGLVDELSIERHLAAND